MKQSEHVTGSTVSTQVRPEVRSDSLHLVVDDAEPDPVSVLAFDDVFREQFSYVCRTLRRFGVREGDLDDVAQDLFVAVHGRFTEWDRKRPIRPWLVSFAYRFAANYARLARHRVEPGLNEDAPSRARSPEQNAEERQAQALVIEALQYVKLERRPVLTMHDIDGFSPSEIARALEIPLNTVYSRLRLARQDFRAGVHAAQRGKERHP
jgi:RNA polymerase sigma-70 factor (ECF subfamily)